MAILLSLLLGTGAALAAGAVNRLLVTTVGPRATPVLGAVVEEGLKTGLALAGGAPLAGVHGVFGLAEGVWEIVRAPGQLKPALAAVAAHGLFGLLAAWAYVGTGRPGPALAAGFFAHLVWNQAILSLHHFSKSFLR